MNRIVKVFSVGATVALGSLASLPAMAQTTGGGGFTIPTELQPQALFDGTWGANKAFIVSAISVMFGISLLVGLARKMTYRKKPV